MVRFMSWAVALAILSSGCEAPDAQGTDVLSEDATLTVNATTECVEKSPDGQKCDRKVCHEDADSDCMDFIERCAEFGHHYNGTRSDGECVRRPQN